MNKNLSHVINLSNLSGFSLFTLYNNTNTVFGKKKSNFLDTTVNNRHALNWLRQKSSYLPIRLKMLTNPNTLSTKSTFKQHVPVGKGHFSLLLSVTLIIKKK